MRLSKGGSLRNGLAMAFASTQCVPSFFTHHLMATAFSLNVRPSSAGSRDFSTYSAMSKSDQSFTTWSFDEPCTTMAWTELVGASLQVTSDTSLWDLDADLIVVGVFAPKKDDDEDEAEKKEKEPPTVELSGEAKVLDEKLGGAISSVMIENAKEFNHGAKPGSATPTLRMYSEGKSQRYIVVGLGNVPEGKADDLLGVGSALGKAIADKCSAEKGVTSAKVLLPKGLPVDASMLSDASCSFYGSLYSDNRYRTGDKIKEPTKDLKTVTFVTEESTIADDAAAAAVAAGKKIASGTHMAKDIVNSPHNVLNALGMADTARRIAKESGGTLKCTILGKKECEKRGMGAFLGVARASEAEPQFIHLTYTPKSGAIKKRVGIIGKGLTFDTGGYNIKTQMMELMKFDCGGAAAVLGAARAIAALQPAGVEAHFVVAACDNMINEKGLVPSDVLIASNGKTIEVLNTDAEGRLTLADAMVYCDKEVGCESIIELSTLTGACMVALGKGVCGFWTENDDLAKELEAVAKVTEEKSWRMPLEKSYNEELKSKIADLQNIGGRYGGAITAALFLQNFVSKKKPFAHIDIAGPVWDDKSGATGFGAKLVTEWVKRQGE